MQVQQTVTGFRDTTEAIVYSLYNALVRFISFLPAIIGAALILIIGWFVSGLLSGLIERGLKAVGFEGLVERSGIGEFIRRSGTKLTTSGIPQLTEIINRIILFIPNVIIAMAIIIIGTFIAQFLSGLVRSSVSELGVGSPELLAKLTQYVIIGFAVIAAIDQLGIAATLVNTLLIGLIGSVALAIGLAFGLGGRDVAAQITQKWYEGSQNLADAAKQKAGMPTGGGAKVYRANVPETNPPPQ